MNADAAVPPAADLAPRLSELEQKLAELETRTKVGEDTEAIRQLMYRYINGLAFTKWDQLLDCFAEDAVFDVGILVQTGKPAIVKFFTEVISKGHHGTDGLILAQPLISVDGDRAKGEWTLYWMLMYELTGQALLWMQYTYDIDYVRVNGEWKIGHLVFKGRIVPKIDPEKLKTPGAIAFPGT